MLKVMSSSFYKQKQPPSFHFPTNYSRLTIPAGAHLLWEAFYPGEQRKQNKKQLIKMARLHGQKNSIYLLKVIQGLNVIIPVKFSAAKSQITPMKERFFTNKKEKHYLNHIS